MLRRYGEQALRDDIRNLLQEWSEDIEQCERVWIRASVSNRRIFLDYEGAILTKGIQSSTLISAILMETIERLADERLRTFPFPTRRPVSPSYSLPGIKSGFNTVLYIDAIRIVSLSP